ncbi:unnamed protein product, partial [marine sediment metagenome]
MLEPPAGFVSAIASDELKVAEIYDLTLLSGDKFYFTSHDKDLVWGDSQKVYVSIPIIREKLSSHINMQAQQVTLMLAGISSELTAFLQQD